MSDVFLIQRAILPGGVPNDRLRTVAELEAEGFEVIGCDRRYGTVLMRRDLGEGSRDG